MRSRRACPTASWSCSGCGRELFTGIHPAAQPAVAGMPRRRPICSPASASSATIRDPRHDLARPVRRAARRRHGAAADLCAGYPADRPAGPRHPARRARVGALLMTAVLARHTRRRVGHADVSGRDRFGAATVVFALSQWMWLSVLALAILGAADIVSVVIRFSLVQLATPDEMRGRVGAVELPVHRCLQPARPVRERRHRRAVRRDAGGRARRRRHHRDRAVVDEAVSDAAGCGASWSREARRPASPRRPGEREPIPVICQEHGTV